MKKKTSKKPTAKKQDEFTYPDDLYYDDLLRSLPNYVLTASAEEKKKRAKKIKEDKAFLKKLITDFKIEDTKKFHAFWTDLEVLIDSPYDTKKQDDDLLQIAKYLNEITDILAFGNPTNCLRLGGLAPEMVKTLEEYKEICMSKHKPVPNHAPTAHQMDAMVAHVGDYLTNVLGIPFTYHASYTKKENLAVLFLNRVVDHLKITTGMKFRGLDAAATRYRKKALQAEKQRKIKIKKRPLK